MGFLSGSVTFERFRVTKDPTAVFGDEHLKILKKNRIRTAGTNLYETPATGFTGGAHLLDTKFSWEKNILGDALHFGVRTDFCQIPGPIKQAWMHIELQGIVGDNPSGKTTKSQRDEAKQAVESRCAEEAEKGNFVRMSVIPVLWDAPTETVYLGGTSEKANEVCLGLMQTAFGLEFSHVTSGKLALELAEQGDSEEMRAGIYGAIPTAFLPDRGSHIVWWNGMQDNYDFLGNEFLLWLWWKMDTETDTFDLSDDSQVSGMFARSLSLDCPTGENGKEAISSDCPIALPEAMMAIRMGKLPRKAGLTLVRGAEQYDFTLKAETLTVGSAKISQTDDEIGPRDTIDRIESIRQLNETLDLLFETFCQTRLSKAWSGEKSKIQKWLTGKNAGKNAGQGRTVKAA